MSILVLAARGEPTARALVAAAVGSVEAAVLVLLDVPEQHPTVEPGVVVVATADDARVLALAATLVPPAEVVTIGYAASAALRAEAVTVGLDGTTFTAVAPDGTHDVRLALVGERHVPAALAALAAALASGRDVDEALRSIASVSGVEPGNLEVVARRGDRALLADGYDLTPASTVEALKTLAEATRDRSRSVAVLGQLDLGGESDPVEVREAHDRIGRLVVRLNVDRLIVVGQSARHIHNAAGLEGSWDGESVLVDTLDEAYDLLDETELLPHGHDAATVVLVKAAATARLAVLAEKLGRGADSTERVTA